MTIQRLSLLIAIAMSFSLDPTESVKWVSWDSRFLVDSASIPQQCSSLDSRLFVSRSPVSNSFMESPSDKATDVVTVLGSFTENYCKGGTSCWGTGCASRGVSLIALNSVASLLGRGLYGFLSADDA